MRIKYLKVSKIMLIKIQWLLSIATDVVVDVVVSKSDV